MAVNALADSKMEMDDLSSSTTPSTSPVATVVSTPQGTPKPTALATESTKSEPAKATEAPTQSPTPLMTQGFLKMRDIYEAGIQNYKEGDYATAITYLKRSLDKQDAYTPKYYYAEANAMLGVIYQFHLIDKKLALQYYKAALDIDPSTVTARKHIGEVSDVKKPVVKAKNPVAKAKKAMKAKKPVKAKKKAKAKSKKKAKPKKKKPIAKPRVTDEDL
jgi:tetratricopeptide (TPR) repeat protein